MALPALIPTLVAAGAGTIAGIASDFLDGDDEAPQPAPPVARGGGGGGVLPEFLTAEQVAAAGASGIDVSRFCFAGISGGQALFRRRRRRRRASLTKGQKDAILFAVATLGKSSDATKILISKVLS